MSSPTLMSNAILWSDAVTDRTQSDVDRAKELLAKGWNNLSESERTEWLNGLKGSFNTSDIERIENNVQLLSDVLELDLTTYYGNLPTYPDDNYFTNLLCNVQAIRNAYGVYSTTLLCPDSVINHFTKVNQIEQILSDVHDLLLANFKHFAGEGLMCGDTTNLLL